MKRKLLGQKKLVTVEMPIMASSYNNGWLCEESSIQVSNSYFWRAFDGKKPTGSTTDLAHSQAVSLGEQFWILTPPYPVILNKITWYYRNDINDDLYVSTKIHIEGYDPSAGWSLITTVSLQRGVYHQDIIINNGKKFSKYRIRAVDKYLIASELKFYMYR